MSLVWDPTDGPGQQHIKRQLVPFGEYLPLRPIIRAVSSYADSAGNFVAGNGNGVVDLNGVQVAVATCYEVAFDDLVTESVQAGATVIAVPTNNATFGRTEMTFQQLAMSRVRAVEHGRTVLIAATSGGQCDHHADGRGTPTERDLHSTGIDRRDRPAFRSHTGNTSGRGSRDRPGGDRPFSRWPHLSSGARTASVSAEERNHELL